MIAEKRPPLTREVAEQMAVSALSFLAGRPEDLGRFLSLTGIGPATLRKAAADPAFLAGVLDFVLGSESLVLAFAEDAGLPPEHVASARLVLGTPGTTH